MPRHISLESAITSIADFSIVCGCGKDSAAKESSIGSCLQGFVNELNKLFFTYGTGNLVNDFAVLEKNQGGDGADAKLSWSYRVVVNIHLQDGDFSLKLLRQVFDDWTDCFAGAAPRGPKINQAWGA